MTNSIPLCFHPSHANSMSDNENMLSNAALLREYLLYLRVEKGLRPLTCEAYERDLTQFAEHLESEDSTLATATQVNVSGFLEHLRKHGVESRSAARKLSCLRGFYRWLLLDKRIRHDPTVNLESLSMWKVLPKSLAESEVNSMMERASVTANHPQADATDLRDRAILELLYAGGLRVSELTNLRVEDLSLDEGRIRLLGKGDKERVVPLGEPAIRALAAYLASAPLQIQSQARRFVALPLRTRQTTLPPMDLASRQSQRLDRQPAQAPPQLRHSHGRARSRSSQRPNPPRPRRHRHHPGLHPPRTRPSEVRASRPSPSRPPHR